MFFVISISIQSRNHEVNEELPYLDESEVARRSSDVKFFSVERFDAL